VYGSPAGIRRERAGLRGRVPQPHVDVVVRDVARAQGTRAGRVRDSGQHPIGAADHAELDRPAFQVEVGPVQVGTVGDAGSLPANNAFRLVMPPGVVWPRPQPFVWGC
jgi:hypothetical protein